jgi:hypothetical protein
VESILVPLATCDGCPGDNRMKQPAIVVALLAACSPPDQLPEAPMDARGALHCHPQAFLADDGGIYVSATDDGGPLVCPQHPMNPEDCGPGCVPLWHG